MEYTEAHTNDPRAIDYFTAVQVSLGDDTTSLIELALRAMAADAETWDVGLNASQAEKFGVNHLLVHVIGTNEEGLAEFLADDLVRQAKYASQ